MLYCWNCIIKEAECNTIYYNETSYTYKTIQEEGVSLDKEVALLKQAIYELKVKNEKLESDLAKVKSETCTLKLFSWCIK